MGKEKIRLDAVDMVKNNGAPQFGATRMPRTAIIPVIDDPTYGVNAGAVSAGVLNVNPLHIIFGVKSPDSKIAYHKATEFVVAVPRKDQIHHMWVTACAVPPGINEIELAGWKEMPSQVVSPPGIWDVPLNLECKKIHMVQLDEPQRCIVVGEVVGVSIDTDLLNKPRSYVAKQFPMHEATDNDYTGLYGPSVLSGELIPEAEPPEEYSGPKGDSGKTFVNAKNLFSPENQAVAANAIFPRPSYILMTLDKNGRPNALPISGGLLMSARPGVQIPVPKNSYSYDNIKRSGEFVYSIATRDLLKNHEAMEKNTPDGFEAAGFSLLDPNKIAVPGLAECPVNVDCKVHRFEDIPGADYALVVAERVGITLDKEIQDIPNLMELYSEFLYATFDRGMKRKWGFHDRKNLSVLPLPSWGSRYHGGWWTGPEQYQAGCQFWLLELVQGGYLSEEEYFKIRRWLGWFRREGYPAPEPLFSELRERLTKIFKMMVWAHRNYHNWHKVHAYLAEFPYEGPWKSP
jgi:flavin reductase (DIM6/NTAB) family NADH-FMN oxidoreductase RutF